MEIREEDLWPDEDFKDSPLISDPAPLKEYTLNEGQRLAKDFLVKFCQRRTDFKRVLLQGYAGTGKTFTINRVVEAVRILDPRIKFGMTAPTHKAVRQLHKHSELKEQLEFGTIHSFLSLKPKLVKDKKDPRKMVEVFEPDPEKKGERRKIDQIDVLIMDEASMMIDELYELIDEVVRSGKVVVIFMGDPLQIPPVAQGREPDKNPDAIPFVPEQRESRKIAFLELSEIVRQGAGNPIIEYSLAIRQQYRNQAIQVKEFRFDDNSGVQVIPRDLKAIRPLLDQYFLTEKFQQDPDHIKIIAWRNDTVDYFNKEVRSKIYQSNELPRILNEDKLVLDKPFFVDKKTMLPNSEELVVLDHTVSEFPYTFWLIDRMSDRSHKMGDVSGDEELVQLDSGEWKETISFKVYKTTCRAMDEREHKVRILHEDSQQEYDQIQKRILDLALKAEHIDKGRMWKEYFEMQKQFAQFKYNYAVTAHKAQGSTYDYAISMEWDIDQARGIVGVVEANRIRYVAATRARNKLFIVK